MVLVFMPAVVVMAGTADALLEHVDADGWQHRADPGVTPRKSRLAVFLGPGQVGTGKRGRGEERAARGPTKTPPAYR